ncbi:MAG: hypothetical protein ACT443_10345 [Gemmatimonadota bacterium]
MSAPGWLTGKADAASLASLVDKLGTQVDVTTVDELFVFPMRRVQGIESTVFVLSIHDHEDLRRVITAHVRATRNKRGEPTIETRLDEQAIVPVARLPRVIEGVLERLSDDFATPPSTARIACSRERWQALGDVLMAIKPNEPLPENLLGAT